MQKTSAKIIIIAINLFNERGIGNVRSVDIADAANMSPGNLTYHFKTKLDLLEAVIDLMIEEDKNLWLRIEKLIENVDFLAITKIYFAHHIAYRFFFRDILEIIRIVPRAKSIFETQLAKSKIMARRGVDSAVKAGVMMKEPDEGHYDYLVNNLWSILNSNLIQREVLGDDTLNLTQIAFHLMHTHYSYLTEKGIVYFKKVRKEF